jgi:DNA replication protein DnaC
MTPLAEQLLDIGMRATAEQLDDIVAASTNKRWSSTQLLEHVAHIEVEDRTRRSLERRLRRSRIGSFKPIADFDWTWPKKIDREAIEAILRADFVAESRNVVLVAAQGLGKTMIAKNIALSAINGGHTVLFTTTAQMLLDLSGQDSARGLERRLRYYAGVALLICDEIGYLSYDNRNADLLFQVISRRYERKSTVLTTNLPFRNWPTVFPNAACVTAMIDRIVHHADIITIDGDSYRRREAEAAKKKRQAKSSSSRKPGGPKKRAST